MMYQPGLGPKSGNSNRVRETNMSTTQPCKWAQFSIIFNICKLEQNMLPYPYTYYELQ